MRPDLVGQTPDGGGIHYRHVAINAAVRHLRAVRGDVSIWYGT